MTITPHRTLAVHAFHKEFDVTIVAAFSHQEHTDVAIRNFMGKQLNTTIKQLKHKTQPTLGIDTNGHIGWDPPIPFIQTTLENNQQPTKWNNNGHACAELCIANSLTATNAMTAATNHAHTWTSHVTNNSAQTMKHRIDYICININKN